MRKNISDIWIETFKNKFPDYPVAYFLLEDAVSCTYLLRDGMELRITVNPNAYNFSRVLKQKNYKHVAKIYECFKTELPNQNGEAQIVFCIVSEPLRRNFASQTIVQSGINLFRDSWCNYLSRKHRLDTNPYNDIVDSYSTMDDKGRKCVVESIIEADVDQVVKDVALAMEGAYQKVIKLDPDALIFPFADNIGLTQGGIIKICNIGHKFIGLGDNYEIETTSNSVTVVYNPCSDDKYIDYRLLMPLKVKIDGCEALFLGQIDTGAASSGFTEFFYKEASLENFGKTKTRGVTGEMDSIRTRCFVTFPNGHYEALHGETCKALGDVSILIGMDLLSRCKFSFEPYLNGFKYKLTFCID